MKRRLTTAQSWFVSVVAIAVTLIVYFHDEVADMLGG